MVSLKLRIKVSKKGILSISVYLFHLPAIPQRSDSVNSCKIVSLQSLVRVRVVTIVELTGTIMKISWTLSTKKNGLQGKCCILPIDIIRAGTERQGRPV